MRHSLLVAAMLGLSACQASNNAHLERALDARFVRPPQADVKLGSLYYARERSTDDLTQPISIEPLCFIDYNAASISPQVQSVADIDLLNSGGLSGALSGIQTKLVSLGLSGDASKYFELKVVNVKKVSLWSNDLDTLFKQVTSGQKCKDWKSNIRNNQWSAYQISAVYIGDLVYNRKSNIASSGEISAKLSQIEPALKAALKADTSTALSGQALVFAVLPIARN